MNLISLHVREIDESLDVLLRGPDGPLRSPGRVHELPLIHLYRDQDDGEEKDAFP